MPELRELIPSIADWQTKTPAELAAEFAAPVPLSDPTPYTFAKLGETLGQDVAALVADTMAAVGNGELALPAPFARMRGLVYAAFVAMSATAEGISLHTDDRQQLIDLLASLGEPSRQWPEPVTAAIKALGRRSQTRFFALGGVGLLPTVEQIATAIEQIELDDWKQARRIEAAARYNAYIAAIDAYQTGDGNPPVL